MMTKLFTFVLVLFISCSAFAQKNIEINFCGKSTGEVKLKDLINCKTLSTNNDDYKVFSFTIGFISGKDYKEGKMTDNVISDNIANLIKEANPDLVYIEQIVLINKQGEKISVEPFKVKK
jgi:hypothetical protein